MRILVTGSKGQVGWELARSCQPLGTVVAFDRSGIDLASPDSIRDAMRSIQPDVILNAAAYTAVDELLRARPGAAPLRVQRVLPITTAEYPVRAVRPRNSRLECGALERRFGLKMPDWSVGVADCLEDVVTAASA